MKTKIKYSPSDEQLFACLLKTPPVNRVGSIIGATDKAFGLLMNVGNSFGGLSFTTLKAAKTKAKQIEELIPSVDYFIMDCANPRRLDADMPGSMS